MEEEVVHNPCGICSNTLDEGETVKLRAKGAYTINKASSERGTPSITMSEGQTVHIDCRKKHVNTKPNRISGKQEKRPASFSDTRLLFYRVLLFCGTKIYLDTKHDSEAVYPIRTFNFQRTILSACDDSADEWADILRGRINFARDLPAADAKYR